MLAHSLLLSLSRGQTVAEVDLTGWTKSDPSQNCVNACATKRTATAQTDWGCREKRMKRLTKPLRFQLAQMAMNITLPGSQLSCQNGLDASHDTTPVWPGGYSAAATQPFSCLVAWTIAGDDGGAPVSDCNTSATNVVRLCCCAPANRESTLCPVQPLDCELGTEWNEVTGVCDPCGLGSFRGAAEVKCHACPPGHFTSAIKSKNCTACEAGKVSSPADGRSCLSCVAGMVPTPLQDACIGNPDLPGSRKMMDEKMSKQQATETSLLVFLLLSLGSMFAAIAAAGIFLALWLRARGSSADGATSQPAHETMNPASGGGSEGVVHDAVIVSEVQLAAVPASS